MSSDDDDYMSPAFVIEKNSADIRPGLLHNHQQQRLHNIYKKKTETDAQNKERFKPQRVIEIERREEGLKSAIGSDNKGFNLLQKMGYKPGSGIGKSGDGRIDPVPIQLKTDRQGLGRTAAIQEIREAKRLIRAQRKESGNKVTPEEFRARMIERSNLRFIEIDLHKSQKACFNLDSKQGYSLPAEKWFWPESVTKQFEDESDAAVTPSSSNTGEKSPDSPNNHEDESLRDDDDDDDFELSEKLEMLTKYLRTSYMYCIWCCVKFDDEKDMEKDCPGPTREDH